MARIVTKTWGRNRKREKTGHNKSWKRKQVAGNVPRGEQYIGRRIHDREQNNYRRLPLFDPGAAEAVYFLGVPCGGNNIFGQRGLRLRFDVKFSFFFCEPEKGLNLVRLT